MLSVRLRRRIYFIIWDLYTIKGEHTALCKSPRPLISPLILYICYTREHCNYRIINNIWSLFPKWHIKKLFACTGKYKRLYGFNAQCFKTVVEIAVQKWIVSILFTFIFVLHYYFYAVNSYFSNKHYKRKYLFNKLLHFFFYRFLLHNCCWRLSFIMH